MAELKTIAETIVIGDGSLPYIINYLAQGQLFGARKLTAPSPTFIAAVTDFLRWQYQSNPTDTSLRQVANYALWLYGIFGMEVQAGQGGGSVIPINPNPNLNPVEFVVDATTSPILAGGSTLYIPQFLGRNILFDRDGFAQAQINSGTSYFNWNSATTIFTCFPAAIQDQLFSINAI